MGLRLPLTFSVGDAPETADGLVVRDDHIVIGPYTLALGLVNNVYFLIGQFDPPHFIEWSLCKIMLDAPAGQIPRFCTPL